MTTLETLAYPTGGDGATAAIIAEGAAAEATGAASEGGVEGAVAEAVGAAIEGGAATGGGAFRAGNVPLTAGDVSSATSSFRFFWRGGSNQ